RRICQSAILSRIGSSGLLMKASGRHPALDLRRTSLTDAYHGGGGVGTAATRARFSRADAGPAQVAAVALALRVGLFFLLLELTFEKKARSSQWVSGSAM